MAISIDIQYIEVAKLSFMSDKYWLNSIVKIVINESNPILDISNLV